MDVLHIHLKWHNIIEHPFGNETGGQMKNLTIREARQSLTHLDRLLEAEGELTITRRGKPVAHVTSVGRKREMPSRKSLRESMPRMKQGSERLVREDRDAR
jgi:antitoxin (DNA-binding transcriptional repressor) of toxin-antitoxin stability system